MYRFRKPRHLIDYGELENQEIFFSDLASLNDPMEGYRDFFWKGDAIIWENFFRHYILCLENIIVLTKLSEEQTNFTKDDIPVFISMDKLPTDQYRKMIEEIYQAFFSTKGMSEYLGLLGSRSNGVNRDELYFHFRTIHMLAIDAILKTHVANALQPAPDKPFPDYSEVIEKLLPALREVNDRPEDESKFAILFKVFGQMTQELDLGAAYNARSSSNKRYFVLSEFPSAYIKQTEKLTYPDTYVACFMDNSTNPVVWAHYGDSHQGVALKFKTTKESGHEYLNLFGIVGSQSGNKNVYDKRKHLLHKINYTKDFAKLNFFTSLGRLTVGQLASQWYSLNGEKSTFHDEVLNENKNSWRQTYWNNYNSGFLTKLEEWDYEKEHRVMLTDILDMHGTKSARKLKYDFEALEGIIFGLKTPTDMRLKIIEIIETKCKKNNRDDFKFYQAQFDTTTKAMVIVELKMLRIKTEPETPTSQN